MPTESLIISINEKGSLTVKRNIADIGTAAKAAKDPVDSLKKSVDNLNKTSGIDVLRREVQNLGTEFLRQTAPVEALARSIANISSPAQLEAAREQVNALGLTATKNIASVEQLQATLAALGDVKGAAQAERQLVVLGNTAQAQAAKVAALKKQLDGMGTGKGLLQASRDLGGIGTSAQRQLAPLAALRGSLAAIAGLLLVKEVLSLADSYANLQNKLRVVTSSQEELVSVTEKLFDISQKTRSSFADSVSLYSRLALSTKELGLNQQQVIAFTESLNKAVVLSGATAQESSAALIQLSQGLASGALRGDELRSVLEQLPTVADVIAKSMGVTRGELRLLGQAGKVSAADIVIAFQKASGELDQRFAKTLPTLGQAFQVLENSILRASEVNLAPLTTAITDLATQISSPAFQQGFATFVGGLVRIAGLTFSGLAKIGEFGQGLGITVARLQGFGDAEDGLAVLRGSISQTEKDIGEMYKAIDNGDISLKKGMDEIGSLEKRIVTLKDAIVASRKEFEKTPPKPAAATPAATIKKPDTVLTSEELHKQQHFIQGLRDQAAELTYQIKLGDAAAASISRYNLAVTLAADKATPKLVEEATKLNEEIIKLQRTSSQNTFTKDLTDQIGALQAQIEAGDQAAQGLLRYQSAIAAAKIGGDGFIATARRLTEVLITQQNALARNELTRSLQEQTAEVAVQVGALKAQKRAGDDAAEALLRYQNAIAAAKIGGEDFVRQVAEQTDALIKLRHSLSDQEVINNLKQENQLLTLGNKQRAIQVELNKLSAEALADPSKVAEVTRLATQQFELQNDAFKVFLNRAKENAQDILGNTLANLFTSGLDDVPAKFADMLKQLSSQLLASEIFRLLSNKFGGGAGGGSSGGGFFSQLLNQFFSGNSGGFGGGNAGGVAGGAGGWSDAGASLFAQNAGFFAEGGSFKVGGHGGTDSQIARMHLTPGERVTVQTPEQQRQGSGDNRPINVQAAPATVIVVDDPNKAIAAMQSARGEAVTLEHIRNNPDIIKQIVS